jgi:hypothetical protein
MARGYWPTQLLDLAKISTDIFVKPQPIIASLMEAFGELDWFLEEGIVENDMVGGWVAAERVGELRGLFKQREKTILDALVADDGDAEHAGRLTLLKIDEALADAERRKLPFAEATEIYSGFAGILN